MRIKNKEQLKRSINPHLIAAEKPTGEDEHGGFVILIIIFLRRDFGARYLTLKRVFRGIKYIGFYSIAWAALGYLECIPDLLWEDYIVNMLSLGATSIAFIFMYFYHTYRRWLYSMRRIDFHPDHTGTSLLRPLAKVWISFLNRLFIKVQKMWNSILRREKKFAIHKDYFYNDISFSRRFLEPLVALILTLVFIYLSLYLLAALAFVSIGALKADGYQWAKNYKERYLDIQAQVIEITDLERTFFGKEDRMREFHAAKGLDNHLLEDAPRFYDFDEEEEKEILPSIGQEHEMREDEFSLENARKKLNPSLKKMVEKKAADTNPV